MSRSPSGGARPNARSPSSGSRDDPIAPVTSRAARSPRASGARRGADNLERYSDYASRLPRGRTYVRNGSVVDLQIAKGEVDGDGQRLRALHVKISIAPVAQDALECHLPRLRGIDQFAGRASARPPRQERHGRVCREGDGLFPAPNEIKLSCSCPDWADMCKQCGGALRRRRPARRKAAIALRAARRR